MARQRQGTIGTYLYDKGQAAKEARAQQFQGIVGEFKRMGLQSLLALLKKGSRGWQQSGLQVPMDMRGDVQRALVAEIRKKSAGGGS